MAGGEGGGTTKLNFHVFSVSFSKRKNAKKKRRKLWKFQKKLITNQSKISRTFHLIDVNRSKRWTLIRGIFKKEKGVKINSGMRRSRVAANRKLLISHPLAIMCHSDLFSFSILGSRQKRGGKKKSDFCTIHPVKSWSKRTMGEKTNKCDK